MPLNTVTPPSPAPLMVPEVVCTCCAAAGAADSKTVISAASIFIGSILPIACVKVRRHRRAKVPGIPKHLSVEIVRFVQALRREDLFKSPGVAETLDWASALTELDTVALDPGRVADTLGVLLKYQDDIARIDAIMPPGAAEGQRYADMASIDR